MKIKQLLLSAFLLLSGGLMAFGQQMTLPFDPDVRTGKLANGLTYYIRHNNWPENRANFYIAQRVGSIQEEESQRGLAHFLEHMAFNGSEHFKGNALLRYCESIGVQFGGDLNAFTAIDKTVYNIDNVPTNNPNNIDSCLLILRDWSCGLLLEQDEIDKERGVIHEEWRMRTGAGSRMFERNLPAIYPGSKYGLRYPIGLMSVVDNFKRKELVDYYHKWYHPSNQGIIVVGNVDVDKVEAEIKKLFGGIQNPKNAAPVVEEPVPDNAAPIVVVDKDKEFQQSIVEVMIKQDVFPDSMKNTPLFYVNSYLNSALCKMLNDRLNERALKADCPLRGSQRKLRTVYLRQDQGRPHLSGRAQGHLPDGGVHQGLDRGAAPCPAVRLHRHGIQALPAGLPVEPRQDVQQQGQAHQHAVLPGDREPLLGE